MFVWLVLLVAATKIPIEELVLVTGTSQNLSNLLVLDIYGCSSLKAKVAGVKVYPRQT
jgi:hypothetical protein